MRGAAAANDERRFSTELRRVMLSFRCQVFKRMLRRLCVDIGDRVSESIVFWECLNLEASNKMPISQARGAFSREAKAKASCCVSTDWRWLDCLFWPFFVGLGSRTDDREVEEQIYWVTTQLLICYNHLINARSLIAWPLLANGRYMFTHFGVLSLRSVTWAWLCGAWLHLPKTSADSWMFGNIWKMSVCVFMYLTAGVLLSLHFRFSHLSGSTLVYFTVRLHSGWF